MPSITIYCEAGHAFSRAELHKFMKTKRCSVCGRSPKSKRGVICHDCLGYIEHARSSYTKCVTCHNNKPKTEEDDMMTPRKAIKKHFIVKAAPSNGKVSGGDVNIYKTKTVADTVAENLAYKEQKTFIIYEAINSFRVARAEESPIVAEEEDHPAPIDCGIDDCKECTKGDRHDVDTECENPACQVCCKEKN